MSHTPYDSTVESSLHHIIHAAFLRSFATQPHCVYFDGGVVILCGEASSWAEGRTFCGKAIVLGRPLPHMLSALGLAYDDTLPSLSGQDVARSAEGDTPYTESPGMIHYVKHSLCAALTPAIRWRPFTRFDYAEEWNNLGFGRIRTDDSIWAAQSGIIPSGAKELAAIIIRDTSDERYAGAYMTIFDTPAASILWCARPVGPVDSTEWTVIERFVSDWRAEDMPCLPCLCQTPANCRCLVTMRLDCDEALSSAQPLFKLYAKRGVPFSLAVKTSLECSIAEHTLLADVYQAGGTLLSHTHTHQYNWGATQEEASIEAKTSRRWFANTFPDLPPVDLAVSPFHSNLPYSVQALAQAGYTGFVSGIIHNDPEYLLGRAGIVPFVDGIVSISQQSMLHGDCFRRQGQNVNTHVSAFEAQYAARGIFGYLDHPFSQRYQYDWDSEAQRLQAHQNLIASLQRYEDVWFWNQQQCFDFVKALSKVRLQTLSDGTVQILSGSRSPFAMVYRYKGREYIVDVGKIP